MGGMKRRWSEDVRWWTRWWIKYFPMLLKRRVKYCRHGHVGPMYDMVICTCCGAPWFFTSGLE